MKLDDPFNFYPGRGYDPYDSWLTRGGDLVAERFSGPLKKWKPWDIDARYKPSTYPANPENWRALAPLANMNDPFDSLRS